MLAGVLELLEFIRKENIKSLIEHIVERHIDRSVAAPQVCQPATSHTVSLQCVALPCTCMCSKLLDVVVLNGDLNGLQADMCMQGCCAP